MAITVLPYIPSYITVHLGPPDASAENVTISFPDYIRNVASSEVYPTWSTAALRANILAQVSFALNRVYTELYPSQGHDFQITNTTAFDQRYIHGRNTFRNLDVLVDDLFTTYLRRPGFAEPLAAHFCNGVTTLCDGLSQWGSEELAQQGRDSVEILRRYYGDNIELVTSSDIRDIRPSAPEDPLRRGDRGEEVYVAQVMLRLISRAYPAVPALPPADGAFGPVTENAVVRFQEIFGLTPDGIVGRATWYRMVYLYTGILRLSELDSLGQRSFRLEYRLGQAGEVGQTGDRVALLQYLLAVVSQFYVSLPGVAVDGVFGEETRQAVIALQRDAGLEPTGRVDRETWDVLVERFLGVDRTVLEGQAYLDFRGLPPGRIQDELNGWRGRFPGELFLGQRDGG